jgi:hypothetical protein
MRICAKWLLLLDGNERSLDLKAPYPPKSTALHHSAALTGHGGSA